MREDQRIVVTGIGVVAPNGIGKDAFWANCAAGVSGIKPITLFDTARFRCHHAGEIREFQPEQHLGAKGLRHLDRTTLLALVASKLALDDARLDVTDANREEIGVVLGSTMGSVRSISDFDIEGLREGPRYVNPAQFPNTVINSPASHIAIHFGLRGLNSTIATGFTAGLDACGYALDMLRLGRAQALLVGGVEELCLQTFLGFSKLGFLARSTNGSPPPLRPFHPERSGSLLGEGAAVLVLEPMQAARQRGATLHAEIAGYASQFHPDAMYRYDPDATGAIWVMRSALDEAEVPPEGVGFVSVGANATRACDAMELTALTTVFGSRLQTTPMSAIKALIGESFSAGGALQLVSAIGALEQRGMPPVFCWDGEGAPALNGAVMRQASAPVTAALVHSLELTGIASTLVVRRPEPSGGRAAR